MIFLFSVESDKDSKVQTLPNNINDVNDNIIAFYLSIILSSVGM